MKSEQVKVLNSSTHPLPNYETRGAAGMDVRANAEVRIKAGETELIPTGLQVAIPIGFEIQVRPRSGLSLKTNLRVANAPGTIDSDYRGEIKVIMTNTGDTDFVVQKGDRIAQMVLCPVVRCDWSVVINEQDLGDTTRGQNGFGSTGK